MLRKEFITAVGMIGLVAPLSAETAPPVLLQGEKVKEGELLAGYNHTANYAVERDCDVNFTADYLYWKLSEDMSPVAALLKVTSTGAASIFNGTGKSVSLNPTYKSGFKVGVGLDLKGMDDWNLYAEYTWYQNKTNKSVTADSGELLVIDPSITPSRYASLTSTELTSSFRLHYNDAELSLQRTFYSGKKLTTMFEAGLRGLWVSQHYNVLASGLSYYETGDAFLIPEFGFFDLKRRLESWSVGPRLALGNNWLLGLGFRLIGDIAGSVLYTRYTVKEEASLSILTHQFVSAPSNYNTVRAITETSLGLGWGSYFGESNGCHFDISARYELNVFWNQGMGNMNNSGCNFYLQGLNLAARIDF